MNPTKLLDAIHSIIFDCTGPDSWDEVQTERISVLLSDYKPRIRTPGVAAIAEFFGHTGLSYAAVSAAPIDYDWESNPYDIDAGGDGWYVADHPTLESRLEDLDMLDVPGCGGRASVLESVIEAEISEDEITLTFPSVDEMDVDKRASLHADINQDLALYLVPAISADELDHGSISIARGEDGWKLLLELWDLDDSMWDADDDDADWSPAMNFAYPLPGGLPREDWHRAMVSCTIVVIDRKEHLALTGGGMDLTWEICETYLRCGLLPPAYFASSLPQMAGRGSSRLDMMILAACRESLETTVNWAESAMSKIDSMIRIGIADAALGGITDASPIYPA